QVKRDAFEMTPGSDVASDEMAGIAVDQVAILPFNADQGVVHTENIEAASQRRLQEEPLPAPEINRISPGNAVSRREVERDVCSIVEIVELRSIIGLFVLPARVLIIGFAIVFLDLLDGGHRLG